MQLDIAAWGLFDPCWDSYYPPGLPSQWRLDFYANEHLALILPQQEWQGEGAEAWLGEAEHLPERLRLYWAIEDADGLAALARLLAQAPLRQRSVGYWWRGDDRPPSPLPLAGLPGVCWLEQPPAAWDGSAAPNPCWNEQGALYCGDGPLRIWPLAARPELAALRQLIQQQQQQGGERLLLPVMPHPGAPGTMQQLQTLAELLGG